MSAVLGVAAAAQAELVTYVIDPTQSTLTVTGTLTGDTATQQTSGSLATSYSGTIIANRNPGLIEFPGGSIINAALQPQNQQPRNDGTPGSQPADYGRFADDGPFGQDTFEALRDIQLDVFDDSNGFGLTITGINFPSQSLQFVLDDGQSDTIFGLGGSPDVDLSGKNIGNSALGGPSTVELIGNIEKLTLKFATGPVTYSVFQTADSSFSFTGQIVATREVPEPASTAVLAVASASLSLRRRRR